MDEYESLIERAEIETGMDSHAPDCGFVDILDALYWVARVKTADCKYLPWCAIGALAAPGKLRSQGAQSSEAAL